MANPTKNWDSVPVWGFYFKGDSFTPQAGKIKLTMTNRTTRKDGRFIYPEGATIERTIGDSTTDPTTRDRVRAAWLAQDQAIASAAGITFDQAAWDSWWTIALTGAVFASFPASDDVDIVEGGYSVRVAEDLRSGSGKQFDIIPRLIHLDSNPPGINLGLVAVPPGTPGTPLPIYLKGVAGGIAALDADGDLINAKGVKVLPGGTGGSTGGVTAAQLLAHIDDDTPHPKYDDLPSLRLLFENGLV